MTEPPRPISRTDFETLLDQLIDESKYSGKVCDDGTRYWPSHRRTQELRSEVLKQHNLLASLGGEP